MNIYDQLLNRTSKRNRIYKHIEHISKSWKSDEPSLKYPVSIEIFPTDRCNLNCKFCSYQEIQNANQLEDNIFEKLIIDMIINDVKAVSFSGGGEPTLHKYLPKALEILNSNSISTGLITNGAFISDELLKQITNLSWIRISLNAPNPEMFEQITGNSTEKFYNVISNIIKIVEIKGKDTIAGLSFLLDKSKDIEYFKEAIDISKELGVNQIFFKPIQNKFEVENSHKDIYENVRNEVFEYAKDKKIVTNMSKFVEKEKNPFMEKQKDAKCSITYNNLVGLIAASGKIYTCISQYVENEESYFGDINENSLSEIYEGEKRKLETDKITDKECGFCKYGNIVREIENYINTEEVKDCDDPHFDFI